MSDQETTREHHPSLAGDFERSILNASKADLVGTWVRFESRDSELAGTIVEVNDCPDGVRRVLIEQESGVVKAVALRFLDAVWNQGQWEAKNR